MAEYDRSATGPLPVDAGPRRAENIFDLSPEDFRASLGEMQALGHDTDALMRQYRARNSIFAPINNAAAAQQQGLADSGRSSVLGGLLSKPEGATGIDAIMGLEREGWRGLLGAGQQVGQAFDAPAAAYQGLIPESDRIAEAVNVAGVTMGAGGAATAPRGALRSGLAREVAESPAQGVARLLREGRASEVTDDVLARLSPNDNAELFRLYDEGATGIDMPMDAASRAARADAAGFGGDAYHGTTADFPAFDMGRNRPGMAGPGVYTADAPYTAEGYAGLDVNNVAAGFADGGQMQQLRLRGDRMPTTMRDMAQGDGTYVQNVNSAAYRAADDGYAGMDVATNAGPRIQTTFGPSNIRSTNARFDPRLSSNANLLAANASQSGGLLGAGLSEAQRQARDILDMRAAGNARSVTDDMMSRADDQYMFEHTPLDMGAEARMARADAGGFDAGTPLYHGARQPFDTFIPSEDGFTGPGVYTTPRAEDASDYALDWGVQGQNVMPLRGKADGFVDAKDFRDAISETYNSPGYGEYPQARQATARRLADEGATGVDLINYGETSDGYGPYVAQRSFFDPSNIRSRFARFDPEFSHLSNLSAANASPTAGLLASGAQEQDKPLPFMEMLRGLLR
jgi:hypothetical protein